VKKISFNGKEYIRASEAAKKFKYTQDYVGQLCRGKKVDARRVGRNWYVTIESISKYRKTKHQTQKNITSTTVTAKINKTSSNVRRAKHNPKRVEAVLRAKTIKNTRGRAVTTRSTAVSYTPDGETLLPILTSDSKPAPRKTTKIQLQRVPTLTLPISSPKIETVFKTEKLPEISLSGRLSVEESNLERPVESNANAPDNITIDSVEDFEVHNHNIDGAEDIQVSVGGSEFSGYEELQAEENATSSHLEQEIETNVRTASYTPEVISRATPNMFGRVFLVLGSFALASFLSLLLVGLRSEIIVTSDGASQGWQFDLGTTLRSLLN